MVCSLSVALAALLGGNALAQTHVLDASDPVAVGSAGNFGRIFDRDAGGYWLLTAANGDYQLQALDDEFKPAGGFRGLTGRDDLVDHTFLRCPDGGYLHVASANLESYDDSAWVYRYDDDFELVATAVINEADPDYAHNDPPAICADGLVGVAVQPRDNGAGPFYRFDAELDLQEVLTFASMPAVGGSSMLMQPDGRLAWVRAHPTTGSLEVEVYADPREGQDDGQLERLDKLEVQISDMFGDDMLAYWPQGAAVVDDHYVVVHLGHDRDETWVSDTGNVFVQIFDADWQWVDGMQVTDFEVGIGAGQPFVHWSPGSDRLQVLYTHDLQPELVEVTLALDAFTSETGDKPDEEELDAGDGLTQSEDDLNTDLDIGGDDELEAEEPDDAGSIQDELKPAGGSASRSKGCSAAPGGGGAMAVFGLLALVGRRRR